MHGAVLPEEEDDAASLSRRALAAALISLVSGAIWGTIGFHLLGQGRIGYGGLLASPWLGLAWGAFAVRFRRPGATGRVVFSLVSLYATGALFGLAVGIYDVATGINAGPGWHRIPGAVVYQSVVGVLWGLTFTGWLLVLWPLSYVNHALLWRIAGGGTRNRTASRS